MAAAVKRPTNPDIGHGDVPSPPPLPTSPPGPVPPRQVRPRATRAWWALAFAAVLAGSLAGISAARLARPHTGTISVTSPGALFSASGGFDKEPGRPAPPWSLPALRHPGDVVSFAGFAGRPVVVNFWASWCPPCRKEMPALAAAARRLAGKVDFVGVDTNDSRPAAIAFAAKTGVAYPLGFDPHGDLASTYGVYGLPTTFFVSAQGRLLGRQVGAMTGGRLAQLLTATFGPEAVLRLTQPGRQALGASQPSTPKHPGQRSTRVHELRR